MSDLTRLRTRAIRLLMALSLVVPVLVIGPFAAGASAQTSDEAGFLSLLNEARAAHGRPALANDTAAAAVAGGWSSQMAASDHLRHNPDLSDQVSRDVTPHWSRLGENVGVGYSVRSLHDAFMNSSGHRANILGDYNRVGIGSRTDSRGRIWVTVVFIKGPALSTPAPDVRRDNPKGSLDGVSSSLDSIRVAGWALDPNTSAPIDVHVYVGGVGTVLEADGHRPDVGAAFPGLGSNHGFSGHVRVPSSPGTYDLCAFGINEGAGSNQLLGCRAVRVDRDPVGSLDAVSVRPGGIRVSGWAADPDRTGATEVHVYVGGVGTVLKADMHRADLAAHLPSRFGVSHGFAGNLRLPGASGVYDLCAYAINVGAGSHRSLGCRSVRVEHSPVGSLDRVARVSGGVRVSGWSLDPNTVNPIEVHAYAGPSGLGLEADQSRVDVAKAFPGYGDRHGFDLVIPAGSGPTTVCVYGINAGSGGNSLLGCRAV